MANSKLTDLTALTTPASGDKLYIVDISDTTDSADGSSRQITFGNLTSTFVTLTGTDTLTNKTLTSAVLTTPQVNDTSADHQYVFAVSELSADRTVTLPLLTGNDTFVFADFVQTLTNKTLTSAVLTTPQVNDTSADHQYVFGVSELSADRTITLPLLTGNDEFVFKDHTQTLTNKTLTSPVINTPTGDVATLTGTQTLSGKTLTAPKFASGGFIADANGNELIIFTTTASAVNEFTVANAITGSEVILSATGGDTNVGMKLLAKGTGEIQMGSGFYQGFQTYAPAGAGTATLDLSLGNDHRISPTGNFTIAISNAKVGQKFLVSITQDGTGSRIATWFTTIRWFGGSEPVLTTTASKRDTFGFVVTAAGTYDGVVVGQNG